MKKNIIVVILFGLLLALVYNKWLFNLNILAYGDWYFFHNESLTTIRLFYLYPWISDLAMGGVNLGLGQTPTWAMYGILAKVFNTNYAVALRLIHIYPIVFLTPLFSFLLCYKITKDRIASVIGSFVYSFNTYFFMLESGTLTLMGAFTFATLSMYLIMITLEKKKMYLSLLTGISLSLAAAYEPRAAYIIGTILFAYFIYYLCFFEKNIKTVASGMFSFIIFGLLNFYWVIGLYTTHALSSNALFSRSLFGNEFLNINYAITLFHPFWTGGRPAIFTTQPIPLYDWLIPIVAFAGLLLNRKSKIMLFFGAITVLGILLTKQAGYPFSWLYLFLYDHLPGFNAFREASKFYFIIAFGYSILTAGFIQWVWQHWKDGKFRIIAKYSITTFVAVIFLLNTIPLVTGSVGMLFTTRHIADDYIISKNFIVKQNTYFRTLWIPTFSRWGIPTLIHPELSIADLADSLWKPYMFANTVDNKYAPAELYIRMLKDKNFPSLLNISSIKYIILPLEDKQNDDDFFLYYGKNRGYYLNELNSLPNLHKIDVGTKDVVLYENDQFKPHVYLTEQKETIHANNLPISVSYSFINPSMYTVTLKNIKRTIYLNFAESYHPNWKIRIGDFHWYNAWSKKEYFIPDKYHIQNDAFLNSYKIDPLALCQTYSCTKNIDGSYTIRMTLFFSSQSYLNFGLLISGTTLGLVIVLLTAIGAKRIYEKYY